MGIPRIEKRTKATATAREIMAEPVDDWFDGDDAGVIVTEAPPSEIMAEPVDEIFDVDDDDDYPEPPGGGLDGYRARYTSVCRRLVDEARERGLLIDR